MIYKRFYEIYLNEFKQATPGDKPKDSAYPGEAKAFNMGLQDAISGELKEYPEFEKALESREP